MNNTDIRRVEIKIEEQTGINVFKGLNLETFNDWQGIECMQLISKDIISELPKPMQSMFSSYIVVVDLHSDNEEQYFKVRCKYTHPLRGSNGCDLIDWQKVK